MGARGMVVLPDFIFFIFFLAGIRTLEVDNHTDRLSVIHLLRGRLVSGMTPD